MLSDANAQVLSWLVKNGRCVFSDDVMPEYVTPFRLEELVGEGYVHTSLHASGVRIYQITPLGEDALTELTEQAKQKANDDADRQKQKAAEILQSKRQNRQSFKHDLLVGIIVAAVTFSLDHVLDIVDFFKKIWFFILDLLH